MRLTAHTVYISIYSILHDSRLKADNAQKDAIQISRHQTLIHNNHSDNIPPMMLWNPEQKCSKH